MSFFKQFPTKEYDIESTGQLQTLVDVSRAVDVNDILAEDSVAYTKYNIIDGARPDIISQLLYNTPEYYWTFFIVNDFLKDGYRAWPKSEVAFENYIDENYNHVIMESPTANDWSFNRFPLNQYLSIYDKNHPQQRLYFKEYNEETFSLKFQRTNPTHFQNIIDGFGLAPRISWPEFINPHNVFSEEYQEVEKIRKQWNIDFFNYMQTISPVQIQAYLAGAFSDDNALTPGTDAYYQRFADYMVSDEHFTSYTNFYNEKNATHHFLNDEGERVSGYNAFYPLGAANNSYNNNPTRVTIYEYERTLNDSLQEIKVIRPERIDEFARRFKELIKLENKTPNEAKMIVMKEFGIERNVKAGTPKWMTRGKKELIEEGFEFKSFAPCI